MSLPDAFNTETPAGQLRLAVRVAGTEQLAALLALKPDRTTMTKPMQDAVAAGRADMAELLLKAGANPDATRNAKGSLLLQAVVARDEKMVAVLLAGGANPNKRDATQITPLRAAMSAQSLTLVKMLLDSGADPYALSLTRDGRRTDMDRDFAQMQTQEIAGAVETAAGRFALNKAALAGDFNYAEALLKRGLPPDSHDHNGSTALINAVKSGSPKIVKLLLSFKANPNLGSYDGAEFPLHEALKKRDLRSVVALAQAGARSDIPDASGKTALQLAEETKSYDLLEPVRKQKAREVNEYVAGMSRLDHNVSAPAVASFKRRPPAP
jgi:ankyrin repeat protein